MPRMKEETFSAGDQSWLGGTHGIYDTRTETLDVSTFTVVGGVIPSGTPVAKVGGVLVPYTTGEGTTTGAGILAGFLYTDQPVVGTADIAVPLLDHGRVRVSKIQAASDGAFTAPVAAAKRVSTMFVYLP